MENTPPAPKCWTRLYYYRSRNGAPSRKEGVVTDQRAVGKASNKLVRPSPPPRVYRPLGMITSTPPPPPSPLPSLCLLVHSKGVGTSRVCLLVHSKGVVVHACASLCAGRGWWFTCICKPCVSCRLRLTLKRNALGKGQRS